MGGRGSSDSGIKLPIDPKNQAGSSSDPLRKTIEKAKTADEEAQTIKDWLEKNRSTEKVLIINPANEEEDYYYKITIDGIDIYFNEDNEQTIKAIKALIKGNKIPDILKEHIDSIILSDDISPSGPEAIAEMIEGNITIWKDKLTEAGNIAHEAAHQLASEKWGDSTPPADSDYRAAIDSGEPPVSEYAKTRPSEDFAEAVKLYINDKERLKRLFPRRYAIINKLMNNRNYNG